MRHRNTFVRTMFIFLALVLAISACAPKPAAEPSATTAPAAEKPTAAPAAAEQPTAAPAATAEQPASGETIELEYWVYADYAQGQALELQKTFISEFEAKHPGIKINIAGKNDADLTTGQIAGAASGTLPDIFMNSTSEGAKLVEAGVVSNIYDRWMAMPEAYRSQFNKTLIANMSNEPGKMWGVPYTGYASILYRNLTVLKAAGIDPKEEVKDWDAWLKQMEKISASGNKAIHGFTSDAWDFVNIYSGVAGDEDWGADFANKKTNMKPEKYAQAMEFMLKTKPYAAASSIFDQATTDLFISNKLAFFINGPWANPEFEAAKAKSGLDYDWTLIPGATPDQKGGVQGTEFLGVAPNKHADLAWEFVTYICDEPQMTRWAQALGRYNSNEASLAKVQHPLLETTKQAAASSLFNWPPFFVKSYPANYAQAIVDSVSAIYEGKLSVEEGSASLIDELNSVLEEE